MTAPVAVRQKDATGRRSPQSALEMIPGFAPWIVYWILSGNVPFRIAAVVGLALSLTTTGLGLVRRSTLRVLETGTTAIFLLLVILTYSTSDVFLGRWVQPIANGGLLLITVASILAGRLAAGAGPIFMNKVVAGIWVAAFAVMTASALVPPILRVTATLADRHSPVPVVFSWIIPFTALGVAGLASRRFWDWFNPEEASHTAPWAIARNRVRDQGPVRDDQLHTGGAHLDLSPQVAPHDAPLHIAIGGVAPGAGVELTARAHDLSGRTWHAHGRFHADSTGIVNLATEAPDEGTYQGVDPMGILWSMQVQGSPDLFVPPTPLEVALEARVDGRGVLRATLHRMPGTEDVRVAEIREPDVTGRLFLPAEPGPHPGVAVVGGFEGGLDGPGLTASMLASHGHAALVVGTHAVEGLPDRLVEVPLERLVAGIRWLAAHDEVDAGRVGGIAVSRGAEGLLAAASLVRDLGLRALVLISPSSVTWQAIGDEGPLPGRSSWTLGGAPLPYHPVRGEALMPQLLRNAALGERMRRAMKPALLQLALAYTLDKERAEQAAIPAERVKAPLLFLSGADDAVWPSARMTKAILERRRRARRAGYDEHGSYPRAGHLIRPPYLPTTAPGIGGIALGGSPGGHAAAEADAWRRVLAFLRQHLGAARPART